jgi:hypothetical protein
MVRHSTKQNDDSVLEEHLKRCIKDKLYGLREMIKFPDKQRREVKYDPWPSQQKFIEHKGRVNAVIKIRRQGFTIGCMASMLHDCRTKNNFKAAIFNKDKEDCPRLFETLKYMAGGLPYPWHMEDVLKSVRKASTKRDSNTELLYPDTKSSVFITTAGQTLSQANKKGRGIPAEEILVTEAGYIENLAALMQGAVNTLPDHGSFTMESTSSGPRGVLSQSFLKIRSEGDEVERNLWAMDDQRAFFFGFLEHPEYVRPSTDEVQGPIDEEEERIFSLGANQDQINWRRWKVRQFATDSENLRLTPEQQFKREYPCTIEDALEEAGGSFFDRRIIVAVRDLARATEADPIEFGLRRSPNGEIERTQPSPGNKFEMFLPPAQGYRNRYVFFADCGQGTAESDLDVGYVLDLHISRFVAKFWGRLGAEVGSECALLLASYYSNALLGWDATGIGAEWRPFILKSGYPNVYYRTKDPNVELAKFPELSGLLWTKQNKPYALSELKRQVYNRSLIIRDEKFYSETEYFGYQDPEDISPNATPGFRDDHISAAAGCLYISEGIIPQTIEEPKPANPFETQRQVNVRRVIAQARKSERKRPSFRTT